MLLDEIADKNSIDFQIDYSIKPSYFVSSSFCWISSKHGSDFWSKQYNNMENKTFKELK